MSGCVLCPRMCGVDREAGEIGFCGLDSEIRIAKIMLHFWEEPSISGKKGSGAIFFSGCTLKCAYCQNRDISLGRKGDVMDLASLETKIFDLIDSGAHNINFVTPTHFTTSLVPLLEKIKKKSSIPIIWNTSGYERVETIDMLDGLVDVYLPDYKYADFELSARLSSANDYPDVALAAIKRMVEQRGRPHFSDDGMMLSGVMVRHLVLPGYRKNSLSALKRLADEISPKNILISLMSQYTPDFYKKNQDHEDKHLLRTLTTYEYESVAEYARSLGFVGFMQERCSASADYTPEF